MRTLIALALAASVISSPIVLNGGAIGHTYDGHGALSAGESTQHIHPTLSLHHTTTLHHTTLQYHFQVQAAVYCGTTQSQREARCSITFS